MYDFCASTVFKGIFAIFSVSRAAKMKNFDRLVISRLSKWQFVTKLRFSYNSTGKQMIYGKLKRQLVNGGPYRL